MATVVKNFRDDILHISDDSGTGGGNTITLVLEEGDLTYTESNEFSQILDRGVLSHVRAGNEVPVTFSFSVQFVGFQDDASSGAISAYEALTLTGGASGWTSSAQDADGSAYDGVNAVVLDFVINDGTASPSAQDTLTFDPTFIESIEFSEGDPSMLSVSGFAFVTAPTIS